MITQDFDIVVVGAGMAGSTAAAHLAPHKRVALVEAEDAPGYHTTGRSAAIWMLNYGPPDVRVLTGLSRDFLQAPPAGFAEHPLVSHRTVIFLAPEEQRAQLDQMLAEGIGLQSLTVEAACKMVPALRPDYAVACAIEHDGFDLDVAAIQQGFLRQLRAAGGTLALRSRAGQIERRAGGWDVHTSTGVVFHAPVIINASGAWGDEVAAIAGVRKLGLTPCRRTAAIIDPSPFEAEHWPMINDCAHTWYARPEARTRLMVSPADETPMDPQDIQPDELDIAIGIDRMQQALDIEVRRVERSWAGLRTFTPDRSLAFGWDATAEGFFWCVGQGGYGIQTSPAAGRLVADLVLGRDPGAVGGIVAAIDPRRFAGD
ncbi:MAG TPA: FAD-binding oxidoreductase [Acetobacteraceae bacterium]|jgi:D-arginine dehydrogenase|nr:FAD-binding oxidoreductase [Acetobacteraceae bacterium]